MKSNEIYWKFQFETFKDIQANRWTNLHAWQDRDLGIAALQTIWLQSCNVLRHQAALFTNVNYG